MGRVECFLDDQWSLAWVDLSLDSEWNLTDDESGAKNAITMSGFKLGDRVEGEDIMNLPLDLAISLLKGSGGIIDIDGPSCR